MLNHLSSLPYPDITPSSEIIAEPGLTWWQWACIGFLACIILSVATILIKRHRARPPKLKDLIKVSEESFANLKLEDLSQNQFAVEVSLIIRNYLTERTSDLSLFLTQEEIQEFSLNHLPLSAPTKDQLSEFLDSLNKMKFSVQTDDFDAPLILTKALDLLKNVDQEISYPKVH